MEARTHVAVVVVELERERVHLPLRAVGEVAAVGVVVDGPRGRIADRSRRSSQVDALLRLVVAPADAVDRVAHPLCRALDKRLVGSRDVFQVAAVDAALAVVCRVPKVHRRRRALIAVVPPRKEHVTGVAVDVEVPASEAERVEQPVHVPALGLRVRRGPVVELVARVVGRERAVGESARVELRAEIPEPRVVAVEVDATAADPLSADT